jgi:hypothetical protein
MAFTVIVKSITGIGAASSLQILTFFSGIINASFTLFSVVTALNLTEVLGHACVLAGLFPHSRSSCVAVATLNGVGGPDIRISTWKRGTTKKKTAQKRPCSGYVWPDSRSGWQVFHVGCEGTGARFKSTREQTLVMICWRLPSDGFWKPTLQ